MSKKIILIISIFNLMFIGLFFALDSILAWDSPTDACSSLGVLPDQNCPVSANWCDDHGDSWCAQIYDPSVPGVKCIIYNECYFSFCRNGKITGSCDQSCGGDANCNGSNWGDNCGVNGTCNSNCQCVECTGVLSVSISGNAPCDVAANMTATNCDGESWEIKENGVTKWSGTVSGNDYSTNKSGTVGEGADYDYDLYVGGSKKDDDLNNSCTVECPSARCGSDNYADFPNWRFYNLGGGGYCFTDSCCYDSIKNCDDDDGCFSYSTGCEERDYSCSDGSCTYSYLNRHTDGCVGIDWYDYYCSGSSCTYSISYNDSRCASCDPYYDHFCCVDNNVYWCDACNVANDFVINCDSYDACESSKWKNYYCSGDLSGGACLLQSQTCADNDLGDGVGGGHQCGAECDQDSDCGVNETCNSSCQCVEGVVFDFSISVDPTEDEVIQGDSILSTVTVNQTGGTSVVYLSVISSTLPPGTSVDFEPFVYCNFTPCSREMIIFTTGGTPVNYYPNIEIKGAWNEGFPEEIIHYTYYDLTVLEGAACECSSNNIGGCCDSCNFCPEGTVNNGAGQCVTPDSTYHCNSWENCDDGDCSATQRWYGCQEGVEACSATNYQSETVYAGADYVLNDDCSESYLSCADSCGVSGTYCEADNRTPGEYRRACDGSGSCNGPSLIPCPTGDCGATSYSCSSNCQQDYTYTCDSGVCGSYHTYTTAPLNQRCDPATGNFTSSGFCEISPYNGRSANKCQLKKDLLMCNGVGSNDAACDQDVGNQWTNVQAYKIANSSFQEVDASSAEYLSTCHDCTEAACTGTLKWGECDGSGNIGSCSTYNQPETVYASAGYTLTSSCGTNGTTYCATDQCRDGGGWHHRCSKRCDTSHNCNYWIDGSCVDHCTNSVQDCDETGVDTGVSCPVSCECSSNNIGGCCDGCNFCPEGTVNNGVGVCVTPNSTYYCNSWEDCDDNDCSATQRWYGCQEGVEACSATNYQSETVYAGADKVLNNDCSVSSLDCTHYCGVSGTYCEADNRTPGEYRRACDESGSCNGPSLIPCPTGDCGATSYSCSSSCQQDYTYTCDSGVCGSYHIYTDCNPYTCSGGSCTSICSQACGAECDENSDCASNNCLSNCICELAMPDLIIEDIFFTETDNYVHYIVNNQGGGDAEFSYSYLYVDDSSSRTTFDYVDILSAYSSSNEYFSEDWVYVSGQGYKIEVCADAYLNYIDESDENNNCRIEYALGVNKVGSGTVTSVPAGINCGSDCSETYNPGTSVTLTAIPDSGWNFVGWSGDCSGTGNCNLIMDEAHDVTATFNEEPEPDFTLSADPLSLEAPVISGASDPATAITVQSLNSFSSNVNLSVEWCTGAGDTNCTQSQPSGITPSFSDSSVTPPADSSIDSTLSLDTNNASVGTYYLRVKGVSGALTHYTSVITLTVIGLSVDLTIAIDSATWQNSLSGDAPLNNVDLKATVSGTAQGTINYKFDCTDDGTWDYTYDGTSANPKQVDNACNYSSEGTYTIRVRAERGVANPAEDTAIVTVTSAPTCNLDYNSTAWDRCWYQYPGGSGSDLTDLISDGPYESDEQFYTDWGGNPLIPGYSDLIGFKSSRSIYLTAGTYKFILGSDDGAKLWIDNTADSDTPVISRWYDSGYTTTEYTTTFNSDGWHNFRIDYYENGGGAIASFSYVKLCDDTICATKDCTTYDNYCSGNNLCVYTSCDKTCDASGNCQDCTCGADCTSCGTTDCSMFTDTCLPSVNSLTFYDYPISCDNTCQSQAGDDVCQGCGCDPSITAYSCSAVSHDECQSINCEGTNYYCTYLDSQGTWEWRTAPVYDSRVLCNENRVISFEGDGGYNDPEGTHNCLGGCDSASNCDWAVDCAGAPTCTSVGLETPTVELAAKDIAFDIYCPVTSDITSSFRPDCVNAYVDGYPDRCEFKYWNNNSDSASFECDGLPIGNYTARCEVVTSSECPSCTYDCCEEADVTTDFEVVLAVSCWEYCQSEGYQDGWMWALCDCGGAGACGYHRCGSGDQCLFGECRSVLPPEFGTTWCFCFHAAPCDPDCDLKCTDSGCVGVVNYFNLTLLDKLGDGYGAVESDPKDDLGNINCGTDCITQQATFLDNTEVTLTATPDSGSTFVNWSGCDSVNGNQCTITMSNNKNISVTFSENPGICHCDSCTDCTAKLADESCPTVYLTKDISPDLWNDDNCIDSYDFDTGFNNQTFDCQGHTINGDETGGDDMWDHHGIYLNPYRDTNNMVIKNCVIKNFYNGIFMRLAQYNTIEGNRISGCSYGIKGYNITQNNILNNIFVSNGDGIHLSYGGVTDNYVNTNIVCFNSRDDISDSYDRDDSGDNNTCDSDNVFNWRDDGETEDGCTYPCPDPLNIISLDPENKTTDSATLRGQVISTGVADPTVYIYWGTVDRWINKSSWDHNMNLGTKGLGIFNYDVSGLNEGVTYYYRFYAENGAEEVWSNCTSFTTLEIVCYADAECDDGNSCTDNVCVNPGTTESYCSNLNLPDGADCSGTPGKCCFGVCDSDGTTQGSGYDSNCRSGPSCISSGNWGYTAVNSGGFCDTKDCTTYDNYCSGNNLCVYTSCDKTCDASGICQDCTCGADCTSCGTTDCSMFTDVCLPSANSLTFYDYPISCDNTCQSQAGDDVCQGCGCDPSITTYSCSAAAHNECQSINCEGTNYHCTYLDSQGTWEWRTAPVYDSRVLCNENRFTSFPEDDGYTGADQPGGTHDCLGGCDSASNCDWAVDCAAVEDTTDPTVNIKIKRTSTGEEVTGMWLNADTYTIQFIDEDPEPNPSGLQNCEYFIDACDIGGATCTTEIVPLTPRSCNSSIEITAGKNEPAYNLEGEGRYYIYSGATDNNDNHGWSSRYLWFDFTAPVPHF